MIKDNSKNDSDPRSKKNSFTADIMASARADFSKAFRYATAVYKRFYPAQELTEQEKAECLERLTKRAAEYRKKAEEAENIQKATLGSVDKILDEGKKIKKMVV